MIELSDGEVAVEVPEKATGAKAIPAVAEHPSKPDPPSATTAALDKKSTIVADIEEASVKLEFSGSFELW